MLAPERVKALVLIDTMSVAWPLGALEQMRGVSEGVTGRLGEIPVPALVVHG